ncbi:MAG: LysR family transcriptional regulator [Paracoccaceae bacterium]|nr:LysR family transcriptional regulator [Paracoccaceae bacterium]MDG2260025.1 LysR family transcriptional regulator [Paracoccaceae bacterium]
MSNSSLRKELSLKGLELFQMVAQKGSLQTVAKESGLSISTVSHHLKNLEDSIGVELFNHSRRPLLLTPTGNAFLRNIDGALLSIRKAKAEASAGILSEASLLRLATIEDFDSDILPELAVFLSSNMPKCDFSFRSGDSHLIIEMLRNRQLDLGVTTSPSERTNDLNETLLLKDPFVIALPLDPEHRIDDILSGASKLPLIRYASDQIIGRQIAGQLKRVGYTFPSRLECSNNQTQLAMVAAGAGWAITTPLLYARAKRFHAQLRLQPFPGKSFSRNLAVYSSPDCSTKVHDLVSEKLRALIDKELVRPFHKDVPWLAESFSLY